MRWYLFCLCLAVLVWNGGGVVHALKAPTPTDVCVLDDEYEWNCEANITLRDASCNDGDTYCTYWADFCSKPTGNSSKSGFPIPRSITPGRDFIWVIGNSDIWKV